MVKVDPAPGPLPPDPNKIGPPPTPGPTEPSSKEAPHANRTSKDTSHANPSPHPNPAPQANPAPHANPAPQANPSSKDAPHANPRRSNFKGAHKDEIRNKSAPPNARAKSIRPTIEEEEQDEEEIDPQAEAERKVSQIHATHFNPVSTIIITK